MTSEEAVAAYLANGGKITRFKERLRPLGKRQDKPVRPKHAKPGRPRTKQHWGVLVDPAARIIEPVIVRYDYRNDLEINRALSYPAFQCSDREAYGIGNRDFMFIANDADGLPCFEFQTVTGPVIVQGKALVLGMTCFGNVKNAPKIKSSQLAKMVRWIDRDQQPKPDAFTVWKKALAAMQTEQVVEVKTAPEDLTKEERWRWVMQEVRRVF